MVNNQWSMVNRQWSIVNGQWSIVNGQWSINNCLPDLGQKMGWRCCKWWVLPDFWVSHDKIVQKNLVDCKLFSIFAD